MSNDEWVVDENQNHDEWTVDTDQSHVNLNNVKAEGQDWVTGKPIIESEGIEPKPSLFPPDLKEFVNPSAPWYKKYQERGIQIDWNDPLVKERLAGYKQDDRAWEDLINAPKQLGKGALTAVDAAFFQPLRGAVAGAAARIDAADQPGLDLHQRLNAFLDPEVLRAAREQYEATGVTNGIPVLNEIMKLRFELAPPVEFWDVISESQKSDIENMVRGNPLVNAETDVELNKFFAQLSTSLISDPATYMGFGVNKIPMLSREGLAADVAAGRKSLVSMKVPFAEKPFFEYNNVRAAAALDQLGADLQANLGIKLNARNLSMTTGMPAADEAVLSKNLAAAQDTYKAKMYQEQLKMMGGYDEKVSTLSNLMAEHGDEYGQLLADKMGIKYTPEDAVKAQQLNHRLAHITNEWTTTLAEAGGNDLRNANFEKPSLQDQKELEKFLKEQRGLDVPRVTVTDKNGKTIDLTYSSQYDFGRALNDEAKEARRIDDGVRSFDRVTQKSGLKDVSASKPRNRLSTQAMESLYAQRGIKNAYRNDKVNLVMDRYLEGMEAARDLKFTNEMSAKYGVMPGQEADGILAAQRRVDVARGFGQLPDYEDMVVANLRPQDFVRTNSKAFDKFKYLAKSNDTTLLKMESQVFPKPIALKIDQVLTPSHMNQGKIAASVEWFQRQWAKNILTSGFRIGKQAVDNISRLTAIKALPEAMIELSKTMQRGASKMLEGLPHTGGEIGLKPDWIDEIAHKLPSISSESIWSLKDFKGPLKVNGKMLSDPETNAAYNMFLKSLHEGAKESPKKFFSIQGIWDKTKKGIKKVLEFPNDNIVANTVRDFGNSADVLTRKAAFRKFMSQGYSVKDSVRMVNEHLMDFENTTQFTKGLRYYSPFASFNLKNLETLPKLFMAQPVLLKTLKPDDGYLAKAWNDSHGWKPEDYQLLNKVLPHFRSQFIGPVLRGQKDLIGNSKYVAPKLQEYLQAGLTDEQKNKMSSMVVSFDVPNFVTAATDFGDLSSALTSPLNQSLMYAAGINPFTGERHTEDPRENIRNILKSTNIYSFPKIYNKVILPLYDKMAPKQAEALRQGPLSADMEKVFSLEFGKSALSRVKLDESTIRELTSMKFMGLARADVHDMNYFYHQMGLLMTFDKLFADNGGPGSLMEKATKGDREDVLRVIAKITNVADDIKFNTKVYNDFKRRFDLVKRQLTPDEAQALDQVYTEDPNAQEQEAVPVDPNEGEGMDFEVDPDQSHISMPSDRMPAASNNIFDRSQEIKNKNIDPVFNIGLPAEQEDGTPKIYEPERPNREPQSGSKPPIREQQIDDMLPSNRNDMRANVGEMIGQVLKNQKVPGDIQSILNHWSAQDGVPKDALTFKFVTDKELGPRTRGATQLEVKGKEIKPLIKDGKATIYLNKDMIDKNGALTSAGLSTLRHEYEHFSEGLKGQTGTGRFADDPYHFKGYEGEFERVYPHQMDIKMRLQNGEKVPEEEIKKWFPDGKNPMDLIMKNEQGSDRAPASLAADFSGGSPGPGGVSGGVGPALTLGAAAVMMGGKGSGPQKVQEPERKYKNLSDEQLHDLPESYQKELELGYRGMDTQGKDLTPYKTQELSRKELKRLESLSDEDLKKEKLSEEKLETVYSKLNLDDNLSRSEQSKKIDEFLASYDIHVRTLPSKVDRYNKGFDTGHNALNSRDYSEMTWEELLQAHKAGDRSRELMREIDMNRPQDHFNGARNDRVMTRKEYDKMKEQEKENAFNDLIKDIKRENRVRKVKETKENQPKSFYYNIIKAIGGEEE